MSSSGTLSKAHISSRFSASAPNLSSTDDGGDDVRPTSDQQSHSHSVSQSQELLPLPPLIFVTPFNIATNRSESSESLSVDPRLLTTSHSDGSCSSGTSFSNVTTPIGQNLNAIMNSELSEPQSQPPYRPQSQGTEQRSPQSMEDAVVLTEALSHRIQDLRGTLSRHQRRARGVTLRGCYNALRGVFGYGPEGTRARKEAVSLATKLVFGLTEVSIVIVILSLAGARKSPVDHTVNEWQACHRPLGVWSALWCVRVGLGSFVAIWMYRHRSTRLVDLRDQRNNTQSEGTTQTTGGVVAIDQPPPTDNLTNGSLNINSNDNNSALQHRNNSRIARLGSVLSLASAVWFIVAHALLYTSTTTCRLSAPHLWWLAFGIVCIGYIVILELIAVVVLIFIIGPLLMLTINLVLICLGREPLPASSSQKIGKLSVKAVESIPLVLYIPAPMSKDTDPDPPKDDKDTSITKPELAHVHSYPPQRECPSPSSIRSTGTRVHSRRSKRWFTFRRLSSKKDGDQDSEKSRSRNGDPYEEKWEKGEYPFVRLEENRAVCAICLCDFEEPKRVRYSIGSMPPLDQEEKAIGGGDDDVEPTPADEEDALRLADAGGGSQPLRLLDCAHVFHKTCIDPWLTGVSGRCPVCQKPVEVKETKKSKRQQRQG